jgi:aspartyl-tRNA synthetase
LGGINIKTIYIKDIELGKINKQYSLLGWVTRKRKLGNVIFFDFYDSTGKIQATFSKDVID